MSMFLITEASKFINPHQIEETSAGPLELPFKFTQVTCFCTKVTDTGY